MEDAIHTIDRLTVVTVLLLCLAAFSVGFSCGVLGMKIVTNKIESFRNHLAGLRATDEEPVNQERDI